MKILSIKNTRRSRGFTLIELLTVIFIIAVLAGMILPAVVGAKKRAKMAVARTEMTNLKGAIIGYEKDYSIYPTTVTNSVDTTYGATGIIASSPDNSDVMDILRNVKPSDHKTSGHPRNPRQTSYIEIKPATTPSSPGITTNGDYNDPWGNPYIISLDNNFDDAALDPIYNSDGHIKSSVLIWSRGPDGEANSDLTNPVNKDNVLGWK